MQRVAEMLNISPSAVKKRYESLAFYCGKNFI